MTQTGPVGCLPASGGACERAGTGGQYVHCSHVTVSLPSISIKGAAVPRQLVIRIRVYRAFTPFAQSIERHVLEGKSGYHRHSLVFALLAVIEVILGHPDVYEPVYKPEPLPYYFNYDVHDDYKGAHFGQNEKSDGKAVYGSYTVALPDGRKQLVEYTADHYKGFVAKVEYTADHYKGFVAKVSYYGKAKHPKYYGPPITFKPSYGYH
ncbi:larval cuticle protein A3A-like [Penaeus indicus]|uniref:larval cuticle protein A3A-like n=1 Tax=Penaeus indicus TaxID=29960 RepID=UPI00300D3754